jgi:hypothetical protein
MSFLESRWRRRRQVCQRRDTALAPEDVGAVMLGASSRRGFLGLHRRRGFLGLHCHLPLTPVEVDDSPTLDIRRPLGIGYPIGALLHLPWLLRRRQDIGPVVAPREDKLLERHRGGEGETTRRRWR